MVEILNFFSDHIIACNNANWLHNGCFVGRGDPKWNWDFTENGYLRADIIEDMYRIFQPLKYIEDRMDLPFIEVLYAGPN